MDLSNTKRSRMIFPAVFFFSFIRLVVFSTGDMIGYDFYTKESTFGIAGMLYFALIFLYSLLIAFLTFSFYRKYGSKCWLPCILLIADPVFLISQRDTAILLVHVLLILVMNVKLFGKRIAGDLIQLLFLFTAATILPETLLGYIPAIFLIEAIPDISKSTNKNIGKSVVIVRLLSIGMTVAGFVCNKIFIAHLSGFEELVAFLNKAYLSERGLVAEYLILSVPWICAGGYFLYIFFNNCKQSVKSGKKLSKERKKSERMLNTVFIVFAFLFIGAIFEGYKTVSAITFMLPLVIMMLVYSEDEVCDLSLAYIDNKILTHPVASIVMFMSEYYFCIRFYLERFGGTSIIGSYFVWVNK